MNVNGMATITIVVLAARGCNEGFKGLPALSGARGCLLAVVDFLLSRLS